VSYLRINRLDEVDQLLELRAEVEGWLAAKGADQFQEPHFAESAREHIAYLAARQRFCVLTRDGTDILSVGALLPPDMDFWTSRDDLGSSWYIGRVMVAEHGKRYGEQLLDLVSQAAHHDGRQWLRLDCWRSNTALRSYYEQVGFDLVRVVQHPHRLSGALFQRTTYTQLPLAWDQDTNRRGLTG